MKNRLEVILISFAVSCACLAAYIYFQGPVQDKIGFAVVSDESAEPAPLPPVAADPISELDGKDREVSPALCEIAQNSANLMAKSNTFVHTNLNLYTAKHGAMRENIAYSGGTASWQAMFDVWKVSPQHEYNRQNGGQYMGYGHATSSRGVNYFVVVYGQKP